MKKTIIVKRYENTVDPTDAFYVIKRHGLPAKQHRRLSDIITTYAWAWVVQHSKHKLGRISSWDDRQEKMRQRITARLEKVFVNKGWK